MPTEVEHPVPKVAWVDDNNDDNNNNNDGGDTHNYDNDKYVVGSCKLKVVASWSLEAVKWELGIGMILIVEHKGNQLKIETCMIQNRKHLWSWDTNEKHPKSRNAATGNSK